jgi:ATP-dependent phosphofructokinase / diphosphate-dependent phosphofructokinase
VPIASSEPSTAHPLQSSLSPLATGQASEHVIDRSGHAAQAVAIGLQRLTDRSTYPLVLGELIRSGAPTATDRQLGVGYGAGAVRALHEDRSGVMVVFQPPDLKFVPLAEAINQVRPVPPASLFVQIARTLGISLGDEVTP